MSGLADLIAAFAPQETGIRQPHVDKPSNQTIQHAHTAHPAAHFMKHILSTSIATFLIAASSMGFAASSKHQPTVCWVETSASQLPAAMGGDGLQDTKVWNSTISSILIRHPKGDVLVDTGFSRNAEAQMHELPQEAQAFGLQIVAGAKDRTPIATALETLGEKPTAIARILITHAHYDHPGGATELTAAVYVASAEATWLAAQMEHPTITPPSLVAAVQPRLTAIHYSSGPYRGFQSSFDVYGDGAIVVVPLPGHTPGSQGVFLKLGKRSVFLIGDAADTLEAAYRGLPKNPMIRAATDSEPEIADSQTQRVAAFHKLHPEIALIPAHDRDAYAAIFGNPSTCVSSFSGAGATAQPEQAKQR